MRPVSTDVSSDVRPVSTDVGTRCFSGEALVASRSSRVFSAKQSHRTRAKVPSLSDFDSVGGIMPSNASCVGQNAAVLWSTNRALRCVKHSLTPA